jgi:hypothetical protein
MTERNIFKRGRTAVDNGRSGWPQAITYVMIKEYIHQRIQDNRRISTDRYASIK